MRLSPLLLVTALCLTGAVSCKDSSNPPPPPVVDTGNPSDGGDGGNDGGTDGGGDANVVILPDGGEVQVPVCKSTGSSCGAAGECCTGTCTGGVCATVVGQANVCRVTGDSCDAANPCCSKNCQSGRCAPADPTCRTTDDVCFKGSDCCSGICSQNNSGTAGACVDPSGSPNCGAGGTPCDSENDCCTNVCADVGTGVKVCQRVSGCQVAGDYCPDGNACCGASGSTNVVCSARSNTCDNGQSCRAPGTICGKPVDMNGNYIMRNGVQFTVSNETNCCNGVKVNGVEQTCRLDEVGVPRCFGGGSAQCPKGYTGEAGCCIAAGQTCDFADQCCDGSACVPGADGVRRCAAAQTCKPVGTTCDPNTSGQCCAGTACTQNSELTFACLVPTTGGTPDAGTPPPPACKVNGGACTNSGECCSSVCTGGVCAQPPQCQPQDAACTTTGDCCTGLSCNIPSGSTSGTCKAGATCSGAGQTCSPTLGCCSGLSCTNDSGAACTGTNGACSCGYIIG